MSQMSNIYTGNLHLPQETPENKEALDYYRRVLTNLNNRNQLKVKRLHEDAQLPEYATEGAACFDIKSVQDGVVPVGGSTAFSTGLSFEIPEGHVMLVYSRSGHGFKNDVSLSNAVGVIDSDYRGCLGVKLSNSGVKDFYVDKGDRIAQGMIIKYDHISFVEVGELSETERGEGGLGSTGVK